jgi:aspartyl/asparaginyl-tRNA synthetase
MVLGYIEPVEFHQVVSKLRAFFEAKGWVEVHTQNRLSILAACEDPTTIATYTYAGQVWPLPQTGQMWLEHELLKNPEVPGFFCLSTSYRNEPDPVPGRHDKIFPMFEFECRGGIERLLTLESELCQYLGFGGLTENNEYPQGEYNTVAAAYNVTELEHEHEARLCQQYGPVFFLTGFPNHTSPFWNMAQAEDGGSAKKVDVLLHGMETIGSAERSCDPVEMQRQFYSISDGMYAKRLFAEFTKERVEAELKEFLAKPFFQRSGGGIGVTRLIRAMKLSGLIDSTTTEQGVAASARTTATQTN